MSQVTVIDTYNARPDTCWSWQWRGALRCTAGMLIEERIRAELDRVRQGHPESRLFGELRDQGKVIADKLAARALQAFARNRLLLIVDDVQIVGLETEVLLDRPIEVTFFRLTPLKAG